MTAEMKKYIKSTTDVVDKEFIDLYKNCECSWEAENFFSVCHALMLQDQLMRFTYAIDHAPNIYVLNRTLSNWQQMFDHDIRVCIKDVPRLNDWNALWTAKKMNFELSSASNQKYLS